MPVPSSHPAMSSGPCSHSSYGGIDSVASSCSSAISDVDVVALEGVDVAGEQLLLRGVELADVGGVRWASRRASPGPAAARC